MSKYLHWLCTTSCVLQSTSVISKPALGWPTEIYRVELSSVQGVPKPKMVPFGPFWAPWAILGHSEHVSQASAKLEQTRLMASLEAELNTLAVAPCNQVAKDALTASKAKLVLGVAAIDKAICCRPQEKFMLLQSQRMPPPLEQALPTTAGTSTTAVVLAFTATGSFNDYVKTVLRTNTNKIFIQEELISLTMTRRWLKNQDVWYFIQPHITTV